MTTDEDSTGRTITGTTSRYDVIGEATYALRDLATGEVLTSGKIKNYVAIPPPARPCHHRRAETQPNADGDSHRSDHRQPPAYAATTRNETRAASTQPGISPNPMAAAPAS